jgi:hypothetical protein
MSTTAKHISGGVLAIIGGFVLLLLLATMWVFGWGFFAQQTAEFRGETQKREQVEASGAFRVGAYDHFFDLCTSVQSNEATIDALTDELDTNPSAARKEQINASLTALRANRATSIAQYNNDASKDYTIGQFRDAGLPPRLDATSEVTTCAL